MTKKKHAFDPAARQNNKPETMPQQECKLRTAEAGMEDRSDHRCEQSGSVGDERRKSGEWIEKQIESAGAPTPRCIGADRCD